MKEKVTYNQFIKNIIDERGQWNNNVRYSERGCERHHILPKCMGGLPLNLSWQPHENIIWLFPQEHFIAHQLLAEENPDNISIVTAWWGMCTRQSNCNEQYIYTSKQYEEVRLLAARVVSKNNSESWWNKTKEERAAITNKQQEGRNNKTVEEKAQWFKSIGDSNKQRTEEEKQITKQKKQNTWANKTEEDLQKSREKRRETVKNNPEIEIRRKLKEKETKSKRTDKQKQESLNKLRNTLANKTEEEKKARQQRRLNTRLAKGITGKGSQNSMAKKILCINTGEIFDCIRDASRYSGMNESTFRKYVRLGKPDIKGNYWKILE